MEIFVKIVNGSKMLLISQKLHIRCLTDLCRFLMSSLVTLACLVLQEETKWHGKRYVKNVKSLKLKIRFTKAIFLFKLIGMGWCLFSKLEFTGRFPNSPTQKHLRKTFDTEMHLRPYQTYLTHSFQNAPFLYPLKTSENPKVF